MLKSFPRACTTPLTYDEEDRPVRAPAVIELDRARRGDPNQRPPAQRSAHNLDGPAPRASRARATAAPLPTGSSDPSRERVARAQRAAPLSVREAPGAERAERYRDASALDDAGALPAHPTVGPRRDRDQGTPSPARQVPLVADRWRRGAPGHERPPTFDDDLPEGLEWPAPHVHQPAARRTLVAPSARRDDVATRFELREREATDPYIDPRALRRAPATTSRHALEPDAGLRNRDAGAPPPAGDLGPGDRDANGDVDRDAGRGHRARAGRGASAPLALDAPMSQPRHATAATITASLADRPLRPARAHHEGTTSAGASGPKPRRQDDDTPAGPRETSLPRGLTDGAAAASRAEQPSAAAPAVDAVVPSSAPTSAATPAARVLRGTSGAPSKRSPAEIVARWLTALSALGLVAAVAVYGATLRRRARQAPAPTALAPTTSAAFLVPGGRVELGPDRRALRRVDADGAGWSVVLPAAVDEVYPSGPLVLGRSTEAVVAIEPTTGAARWSWRLPADEQWGPAPSTVGRCLLTRTTRAARVVARCLGVDDGAARWTTVVPRGASCTAPAVSVPGGVVLPCAGWAAVLDERSGASSVEAGAFAALPQPPSLLQLDQSRGRTQLLAMPWVPQRRTFSRSRAVRFAAAVAPSSISAAVYQGRVLVRGGDASDELAVIYASDTPARELVDVDSRLADDTPLVTDCGPSGAPRFQLLELAPRLGESFAPDAADRRALALLDTQTGEVAWKSRWVRGLRRVGAPAAPPCSGGHYFLPLELGEPSSADDDAADGEGDANRLAAAVATLWIVDAATGKTAGALRLQGELAAFSRLGPGQLDGERLLGLHAGRPVERRWRALAAAAPAEAHAGRAHLEHVLGPLP